MSDACPHLKTGFSVDAMKGFAAKFQKENQQRRQTMIATASCKMCKEHKVDMWMCTVCCEFFCGRNDKEHTYTHYEVENHPVFLKLEDLSLWCYPCNSFIDTSSRSSKYGAVIAKMHDLITDRKSYGSGGSSGSYVYQRKSSSSNGEPKLVKLYGAAAQSAQKAQANKANKQQAEKLAMQRHITKVEMSDDEFYIPKNINVSCIVREKRNELLSTLVNLGNTCYINSILQVLSHIPVFARYFVSLYPYLLKLTVPIFNQAEEVEGQRYKKMLLEFTKLIIAMQSITPENITPKKFVNSWKDLEANESFRNDAQHDCSDFMLLLFEQLGIALTEIGYRESDISVPQQMLLATTDPSLSPVYLTLSQILQETINQQQIRTIVDDTFEGTLMTVTKCTSCDYKVKKFERFMQLSVPILDNVSSSNGQKKQLELKDLLKKYFNPEQYFECQKCGKKTCHQKSKIVVLPEILVIQIQRLMIASTTQRNSYDTCYNSNNKNSTAFNSPEISEESYSDMNNQFGADIGACRGASSITGVSTGQPGIRKKEENKIMKVSQTIHCDIQDFDLREFLAKSSVHLLNDKFQEPEDTMFYFNNTPQTNQPPSELETLVAKYGGYSYDLISTIEHNGHRSSGHYQAKVLVNNTGGKPKIIDNNGNNKDLQSLKRNTAATAAATTNNNSSNNSINNLHSNSYASGNILNNNYYYGNQNSNTVHGFDDNISTNKNDQLGGIKSVMDDEWYLFSDKDKKKIDRAQILTPNTYLLFYKKVITKTQLRVRRQSINITQKPLEIQKSSQQTNSFGKNSRERIQFDLTKRINPLTTIEMNLSSGNEKTYGHNSRTLSAPRSGFNSNNSPIEFGSPYMSNTPTMNNINSFSAYASSPDLMSATSVNSPIISNNGDLSATNNIINNINNSIVGNPKNNVYTHFVTGEWLYRLHTMKYPGPINYNCFLELINFNVNPVTQSSHTFKTLSSPSLNFLATPTTSKLIHGTDSAREGIITRDGSQNDIEQPISPSNSYSTAHSIAVTPTVPSQRYSLDSSIQHNQYAKKPLNMPDLKSNYVKIMDLFNMRSRQTDDSEHTTSVKYTTASQQSGQNLSIQIPSQSPSSSQHVSQTQINIEYTKHLQSRNGQVEEEPRIKYSMLHDFEFNPMKPRVMRPIQAHSTPLADQNFNPDAFNKNMLNLVRIQKKEGEMNTSEAQKGSNNDEEIVKGEDIRSTIDSSTTINKQSINDNLNQNTNGNTVINSTVSTNNETHNNDIIMIDYDTISPPQTQPKQLVRKSNESLELKALKAILLGNSSILYFHLPSKLSTQYPMFIPLTEAQFNALAVQYGIVGRKPLYMKDILGFEISTRQIGRAQFSIIRKLEASLESTPQIAMSAVSKEWLNEFIRFVDLCFSSEDNSNVKLPPTLTNKKLMKGADTIKPNLVPSVDYVLIPIPIFKLLCKWYSTPGDMCYDIRCCEVQRDNNQPILSLHNKHTMVNSYEGSDEELILR